MSILIKGIEMPNCCGKCPISCLSENHGCYKLRCNLLHRFVSENVIDVGCPLIKVPPHGRLIDADALLADVRAHSESYFADDFAHEWVDVAPTVIDAESYSERELQRDYEASVEYAQYCERYEPTYDPDTGAM